MTVILLFFGAVGFILAGQAFAECKKHARDSKQLIKWSIYATIDIAFGSYLLIAAVGSVAWRMT